MTHSWILNGGGETQILQLDESFDWKAPNGKKVPWGEVTQDGNPKTAGVEGVNNHGMQTKFL